MPRYRASRARGVPEGGQKAKYLLRVRFAPAREILRQRTPSAYLRHNFEYPQLLIYDLTEH
jgi:hypothetical protein